jgi:hypothetical protein
VGEGKIYSAINYSPLDCFVPKKKKTLVERDRER